MPQPANFESFAGGINQSLPAAEIADNELADALNYELDDLGHLSTRRGFEQGYSVAPTPWDSGTPGTPFEHYPAGSSNPGIIIPKGTSLYSFSIPTWAKTDVTGGLTLPANAKWQWIQMDDRAIGVNGGTGPNVNPVSIPTLHGTAVALSGDAPKGRYIEYWNRRVFIVPESTPNQIDYCAVGDATDWLTTGTSGAGSIEVGLDEFGDITGIKAWKGRLFIFKVNAIYMLVPGNPQINTDQWQIIAYATNIGCVSAWTIQQVGDDVVFLSSQGVASLRALEGGVGEFAQNSLSRQIPALRDVPKDDPEKFTSVVWPQKFQYWLGVPRVQADSSPTQLWVMDYRPLLAGQQRVAWMKWDGDLVETKGGYCILRTKQAKEQVVVNADYPYVVSHDSSVFEDDPEGGSPTMSKPTALTKAFSFGAPLTRKEFYFFGTEYEVLSSQVNLAVRYRFDENDGRSKQIETTFNQLQTGSILGGPDLLGTTFKLLSTLTADTDLMRSFRGKKGRRGQTLQFHFSSLDSTYGFVVRRLKVVFDYLLAGQKGIDDTA